MLASALKPFSIVNRCQTEQDPTKTPVSLDHVCLITTAQRSTEDRRGLSFDSTVSSVGGARPCRIEPLPQPLSAHTARTSATPDRPPVDAAESSIDLDACVAAAATAWPGLGVERKAVPGPGWHHVAAKAGWWCCLLRERSLPACCLPTVPLSLR